MLLVAVLCVLLSLNIYNTLFFLKGSRSSGAAIMHPLPLNSEVARKLGSHANTYIRSLALRHEACMPWASGLQLLHMQGNKDGTAYVLMLRINLELPRSRHQTILFRTLSSTSFLFHIKYSAVAKRQGVYEVTHVSRSSNSSISSSSSSGGGGGGGGESSESHEIFSEGSSSSSSDCSVFGVAAAVQVVCICPSSPASPSHHSSHGVALDDESEQDDTGSSQRHGVGGKVAASDRLEGIGGGGGQPSARSSRASAAASSADVYAAQVILDEMDSYESEGEVDSRAT